MTDIYVAQFEGLVTVHAALAGAFGPLIAGGTLDELIPKARTAVGFLMGHHGMESNVLFPGLRAHGRLRSTDCEFLDARGREHDALHRLADELLTTTTALHPHAATISKQAKDLMDILGPHTREEEQGMAPDRLRTMIDIAGLEEINRQLDAARTAALARLAASGITPPNVPEPHRR